MDSGDRQPGESNKRVRTPTKKSVLSIKHYFSTLRMVNQSAL